MNPGQPWTHKNQGQKIMFGGITALINKQTGVSNTTEYVEAQCKKTGVITPLVSDLIPKYGLGAKGGSGWWVAASGDLIVEDTSNTSTKGLIYKGKRFHLPNNYLLFPTILDANYVNGRVWVTARGSIDGTTHETLWTAVAEGVLTYVADTVTFSPGASASAWMQPSFNKECTELTCGKLSNHVATVTTIPLNTDGTVGAYVTSTWDGGYSGTSGITTFPDFPTVTKQGNIAPEVVGFPGYDPGNTQTNPVRTVDTAFCSQDYIAISVGSSYPSAGYAVTGCYLADLASHAAEVNLHILSIAVEEDTGSYDSTYPTRIYTDSPDGPIVLSLDGSSWWELTPAFERVITVVVTYKVDLNDPNETPTTTRYRAIVRRCPWYTFSVGVGTYTGPDYVSSGSSGYNGIKPLGWARNADTGVVDQVWLQMEEAQVLAGSISGTAKAQGYGFASILGLGLPADVRANLLASTPASQSATCSWSSSIVSPLKEGLYVGGVLQAIQWDLQSASSSQTGSVTNTVIPNTATTGDPWTSYSSVVTTPNSSPTTARSTAMVGVGDYRARILVTHEATQTSDHVVGDPTDGHTAYAKRSVYKNGVLIYQDAINVSNANSTLRDPFVMLKGYYGVVPFGKKNQMGYLIAYYSAHRPASGYWGDFATGDEGSHQLLIDSGGNVYTEVPMQSGPLDIGPSFNAGGSAPPTLHLNLKV